MSLELQQLAKKASLLRVVNTGVASMVIILLPVVVLTSPLLSGYEFKQRVILMGLFQLLWVFLSSSLDLLFKFIGEYHSKGHNPTTPTQDPQGKDPQSP
jgi:hypothetical protein